MYRILTASKDTYITDRVINNRYRATDANTGQAGTLDLFKLYNESTLSGSNKVIELSRILLKFDLNEVKTLHSEGKIDITDSTFNATIKLHDVYGGQTTPNNFKCIVFPLARDFDEGAGYDIVNYSDLDSTNFITASISGGAVDLWRTPGAMKSGSLSAVSSIDVIISGTIPGEEAAEQSLSREQFFATGEEDLEIDVTKVVSASVKDIISDKGFLVALSGAYEKDTYSYFVKRFASRNSANTSIRPKLIIRFDDSIQDNHQDFIYNVTGSLYLSNIVRNELQNIVKDADGSTASGNNCLLLKIQTGSFRRDFQVSQILRGTNRVTGIYSSSFAVSSFGALYNHVLSTGSIVFDEIWSSTDETKTFLSSSLTIKQANASQLDLDQTSYHVIAMNLNDRYRSTEEARVRTFVEKKSREVVLRKTPFEKKSEVFHNMHYRVRDFVSGDIIVPFDKTYNSTKLSSDSRGMYFDFHMSTLPRGRTYIFDFLIINNGYDTVIDDAASKFIVE